MTPRAVKMVRHGGAGLAGVVGLAVLLVGATTSRAAPAGPEVKIGVLWPRSGPFAALGEQQEIALRIAREEINAAGGIGGVPVRFIIYDTGGKLEEAISLTRRLAQTDKVLAILGPFTSGECEAAFPVANRERIVALSAASAKPGVGAVNRPWAFRNSIQTMKQYTEEVAKFLTAHPNVKTAAIVYDTKDAIMRADGTLVFPGALKRHNITVTKSLTFLTGDVDFSAQATTVAADNPDAVVVSGFYGEGGNFMRALRKAGYTKAVIGGMDLSQARFIEVGGAENVAGTYSVTAFWEGSPDPRVQAFLRKYVPQYGGRIPHWTAASLYDSAYILKKVIEESGATNKPEDLAKDRDRIRRALQDLKGYSGLTGMTTINKDGDADKETFVVVVKNGTWTLVE